MRQKCKGTFQTVKAIVKKATVCPWDCELDACTVTVGDPWEICECHWGSAPQRMHRYLLIQRGGKTDNLWPLQGADMADNTIKTFKYFPYNWFYFLKSFPTKKLPVIPHLENLLESSFLTEQSFLPYPKYFCLSSTTKPTESNRCMQPRQVNIVSSQRCENTRVSLHLVSSLFSLYCVPTFPMEQMHSHK